MNPNRLSRSQMDPDLDKMRQIAHQKLLEQGEKDRLKNLLKTRLSESGFNDAILEKCKEYVRTRGVESVNVSDIVAHITPEARKIVPEEVRDELLENIKKFIAEKIPRSTDDRF